MKGTRNFLAKTLGVGIAVSMLMLSSVAVFAEEAEKENLAKKATFTASTYWGNEDWVSPAKLNDGDLSTRWASADEDRAVYVEIDFGTDTVVGEVKQIQGVDINGPVITNYTISYWNGSEWTELVAEEEFEETAEQETNGKYAEVRFAAVKTQKLRIDYEATWGITLYEIEVYGGTLATEDNNQQTGGNTQDKNDEPQEDGSTNTPKTGDISMMVSFLAAGTTLVSSIVFKKKK